MKKFKSRLYSEIACYHWLKNYFSSYLLPRNIKIKIYPVIIFHNVLNGRETGVFYIREECSVRMLENRIEVTGDCRNMHNRNKNHQQRQKKKYQTHATCKIKFYINRF